MIIKCITTIYRYKIQASQVPAATARCSLCFRAVPLLFVGLLPNPKSAATFSASITGASAASTGAEGRVFIALVGEDNSGGRTTGGGDCEGTRM